MITKLLYRWIRLIQRISHWKWKTSRKFNRELPDLAYDSVPVKYVGKWIPVECIINSSISANVPFAVKFKGGGMKFECMYKDTKFYAFEDSMWIEINNDTWNQVKWVYIIPLNQFIP
jgi:hypothetical protein